MYKLYFENLVPKFLPRQQKSGGFSPQNWAIFGKNFKIWEINKNHLSTPYIQILGHLRHFWPKNWNFCSFFGAFSPLLIYKGKCWLEVIPPLALSAITFEPLNWFKKFWEFWKLESCGFQMVYELYQNSKMTKNPHKFE